MVNLGGDIDGIEFENGDEIRDEAGEALFAFAESNSPFATESYVGDVLDGYATETYVDDAVDAVESDLGATVPTVNVVDDLGLSPDLSDTDVIATLENNGPARFVFPEGQYYAEKTLDVNSLGWTEFAIEGLGDGFEFVVENDSPSTIVQGEYDTNTLEKCRLANFDVVLDPANGIDCGLAVLSATERVEIEDVSIQGQRTYHSLHGDTGGPGTNGSIYCLRLNMVEPNSGAYISNVRFDDGGEGNERPRVIPFSVEPPNEGTIVYESCSVTGWQGNGYYLKDGTGTSILFGCSGTNIGGQAFRFGQQDMSIGGRTITDAGLDNYDHTGGTHIDIHRAEGTSVLGHRCYDEGRSNEIIRARSGNEQATVRDVYVYSTGTPRAIRTSSNDQGDDTVATHGQGYLSFENIRIIVESDTDGATYLGAIENRRANTVYKNVSTRIDVPNTGYASAYLESGDATFRDCRFMGTDANSAAYSVLVGPRESAGAPIERFHFDNCEFSDGVYAYSGNTLPYVGFVGCDFTAVSTLFPNEDLWQMYLDGTGGTLEEFVFLRNSPYTASTDYGELGQAILRGGEIFKDGDAVATEPFVDSNSLTVSQDWDGNSLTLETPNGDTIDFILE